MSDNFTATPGTGATFGMDEVVDGTLGTVKVAYGKIMDGTVDSTNKLVVDSTGALSNNQTRVGSATVLTGNGVTGTGSQRVTVASDNSPIPFKIDQTTPGTTNKVDIADSLNNPISAFPATFLRTSDEPRQVFYDPFEGAIDTTDRWTSTTGSSGVAASNTTGVMTMGTGTTANGYSKLTSKPNFTLPIPGWLGVSDAIALPDGAAPVSNSYLYWGTGTTPGTPSVATPITDGYGFERNTDGKLRAVVYAGGTRTIIQDLSTSGNSTQPTDAAYHRYIIYVRTDRAYWYIDGLTSAQLVATSNFQSSQVQTLPRLFLTVGNSTPPVSNITITCTGATAWDTGKNATQLADGTFPWRKQTVKAASTAAAATDTPAVVALHPSSPTPTGTNNIGTIGSSTGSAVPATAQYQGVSNGGTLVGLAGAANQGDTSLLTQGLTVGNWIYNGTTFDRQRSSGPTGTAAVAGTFTEQASLTAGSLNADFVPSTDVSAYKWISVQIVAIGSLTVNWQGSNNNVDFVSIQLANVGSQSNNLSNTANSTGIYQGPLSFRYFRARITSYGSGTVTGVADFYTVPTQLNTMGVGAQQIGTWTVGSNSATGSAVPANGHYMAYRNSAGNLTGLNGDATDSDGKSTNGTGVLEVLSLAAGFNGTTFDRQRHNTSAALIAAGTTSTQSAIALTTYNAAKLTLVINIASATAATLTVTVSGTTSTSYVYTLGASTALATVSVNTLMFGPGLPATANSSFNVPLPRNVLVTATVTGTISYGIDANLSI